MYIQLTVRITYFLGAVLSGILIPSLGSSFPDIQDYAVKKKSYSEKVTQLHSNHTANKKNTIYTSNGTSLQESFENVRV